MSKHILCFFLSFCILANAMAQTPKINFDLHKILDQNNSASRIVSVLIKGDPQKVKAFVLQAGGRFKYAVGGICSVTMPLNSIRDLALKSFVTRMEISSSLPVILDDSTDINVHMAGVRDSIAPLDKLYTGKGVVIGDINGGIDIHHFDFRNADSTTRIKFIWDQNDDTTGNPPAGYGYGTEWTEQQINSGTCPYQEQWHNSIFFTHGSNVMGAAAGNGLADGFYPGIATKADLIIVSWAYNVNDPAGTNQNSIDGIKYIFDKADQLGEPCVINASFTPGYDGSHDGKDLESELIDSLIAAKNGRIIVCGIGDAGAIPFHLGHAVNADTSFTWFTYNANSHEVLFDMFANKTDFENVNFSVGADDTAAATFSYKGNVRFRNVIADFHNSPDTLIQDTLIHLGHLIGTVNYFLDIEEDSVYHLGIIIQTDSTFYCWRFLTTGNGYFDAWNHSGLIGTSSMVSTKIPDSTLHPAFRYYKFPDFNETTGSSFTCSDHVISVGNFKNRNSYIDYNNDPVTFPSDTVGARSLGSSIGPTRDGRIKPDVAAPGDHTLAACNASFAAAAIAAHSNHIAFDSIHSINGGSSMSSPVVSGIVALYLEKHPQASWRELINVIQQRTYKDQFTGNALPNGKWGYGKVDAFDVLTSIYGCTDPNAENYDSLANVDNDSCIVVNGVKNLPGGNQISCFPNPAKNFVQFNFQIPGFAKGMSIDVYDLKGKLIRQFPLLSSQGSIDMQLQSVSSGIYFYRLEINRRPLETHKFACIH